MNGQPDNPFVHLELHTGDLPRAAAFYSALFGWRAESVDVCSGSYLSLATGNGIEGGVVECRARRPLWLPYVEVGDIFAVTERARGLGATVTVEPREGPAGWRSSIAEPAGAEVALWQPRRSSNGCR